MLSTKLKIVENSEFATELATREAHRERNELYGREYDQVKITYNDMYFQQNSLWPIFFLFLPGSCHQKLAELTWADLIIPLFTKFGSH